MNRVLIIDDSKTMRKFVSNCITSVGFQVVGQAEDGDVGVDLFTSIRPDIVLLDVSMPNKDGRQCLKEILEIDPKATVIMLSSIDADETVSECIKIGAKAFLNKSKHIEPKVLQGKLRNLTEITLKNNSIGGES